MFAVANTTALTVRAKAPVKARRATVARASLVTDAKKAASKAAKVALTASTALPSPPPRSPRRRSPPSTSSSPSGSPSRSASPRSPPSPSPSLPSTAAITKRSRGEGADRNVRSDSAHVMVPLTSGVPFGSASSRSVPCKRYPTVASVNVAKASKRAALFPPEPASTPVFPRRHRQPLCACGVADRERKKNQIAAPQLREQAVFVRCLLPIRFGFAIPAATLLKKRETVSYYKPGGPFLCLFAAGARPGGRPAARPAAAGPRRRGRRRTPRRARRRRGRRRTPRRARRRRRRRRHLIPSARPAAASAAAAGFAPVRTPGTPRAALPPVASPRPPSPPVPLPHAGPRLRVVRLHLRLHERLLGERRRPAAHAGVPGRLSRAVAAPELAGVVVGPRAQDVPRGVPRQAPDRGFVPALDLRARPGALGVRVGLLARPGGVLRSVVLSSGPRPTIQYMMEPSNPPLVSRVSWCGCHARDGAPGRPAEVFRLSACARQTP